MSKVTLNSIGSRYGSLDALNDNFDQLEAAIDNTLSRDGTGPNSMEAPLDMGANPILNVSTLQVGSIVIGGQSLEPGEAVLAPSAIQVFEYTSTANQTSFSVAPFEVTSNSVEVEVNGFTLPPSTVSTSLTSVTIPAQPAGRHIVIRVFTRDLGAAPTAASVVYTPLSGNSRSIQAREREVFRVTDWGADPTGVADSTSAFTNAITYLQTLDAAGAGNGSSRPTLHVPAGVYRTNALSISKRLSIVGDGSGCTVIRLNSGQTSSLFTFTAENLAATSIDDSSHSAVRGVTLVGARVDDTTTGVSHGIFCPDTAWSESTQYSPSVRVDDVVIFNFTGYGLYFGINRNWPFVNTAIVRYCNDGGVALFGYDGRFVSCDFGVCKNFGIREFAGGANTFTGCNIYFNDINYVSNVNSNAYSTFTACSFDGAVKEGVSVAQATGLKQFIGCRFSTNSRAGNGLYSDILVSGASSRVSVIGCHFQYSTQGVKNLVETASNPRIYWVANDFVTSGSVPYVTTPFNNPGDIILAGDSAWSIGAGGSFGTISGPLKLPSYTVAGLPSAVNLNGAQVYVSNESGGAVVAFSDGTNWRRVTDRAVVS